MPQFNPTVLRVDTSRERWEQAEDVICFTDLILRWPHHAIINIAYELHADIYDGTIDKENPPLALYLCDDVLFGQDGQQTLRLRPIHINTPFDPFLPNIPSLVVLRRVVERLEKQHPNYAAVRPLKYEESSLLLAMLDNLNEIAIYILRAWQLALNRKQKIKDGNSSLKSDFWTEILVPIDDLLQLVPRSLAAPFTVIEQKEISSELTPSEATKLPTKKLAHSGGEKTKEEAKEFLLSFKLKTPAERLIALKALLNEGFPRFKNEDIGELLWPDCFIHEKTRKRYGSRLYSDLQKNKEKK